MADVEIDVTPVAYADGDRFIALRGAGSGLPKSVSTVGAAWAANVRDALVTLTTTSRLPASAVRDLPTYKEPLWGNGAPTAGIGKDGDTYIDGAGGAIYGPKSGGAWPPIPLTISGAGEDVAAQLALKQPLSEVLTQTTAPFTEELEAGLLDVLARPDYLAEPNEFQIGDPDGNGGLTGIAGADALAIISDGLQVSEGVATGSFDLVMSTRNPVYVRTLTGNATLDSISGASLGQAVFLDLVQDAVEEYTFGVNAANFDVPASGLDNDLTASSITRYWIRPLITGKHIIRRITEVA